MVGRENIYLEDEDRDLWLDVLGNVCERFNWVSHAYCQMSNHYHHLLIETPDGNLATGMRQLNGVYTQRFNQTHNRVGHVFQGRYKAILVERDTYPSGTLPVHRPQSRACPHGARCPRLALEQLPGHGRG